MRLIYVIGPPGAGKSTLVAELTREQEVEALSIDGVAAIMYRPMRVLELGRRREAFSGTDALGMAVMPRAIGLLDVLPALGVERVLAEGDRLASWRFFDAAIARGYELVLVSLRAPDEVLALRRAQRATSQSPTWVRGRATKCARLVEAARARPEVTLVELDSTRSPAELAARLAHYLT